MRLFLSSFPAVMAGLGFAVLSAPAASPDDLAFFETKIRPVLAEKCYSCHSAEAEKLKAGLQVDHREHLLGGGETGPALLPGKPEDSLLIETIRYGNPDQQMPPKGKLPAATIADFEKWIALGAPWPDEPKPVRAAGGVKIDGSDTVMEAFDLEKRKASHWSWKPIARPDLPAVKLAVWPKSGIDHFILARLEADGLRPAEDAAPEIWLRRVYFDLIGLPPSLAELSAFLQAVAQSGPEKAYAAEVDKLLASPHYGERWARHWMDLARYGESSGHEFDYPIPHAFRYRDYLIDAYNRDLPHDRFLTEHLAGDLLEKPRLDPESGVNQSIQATGFWFLHEAVHAPTDIRGDEAGRIDNQIDVFAKSFLGITLACARCHDHKFDAIGTADYYAMAGYLQSSRRQDAFLDPRGDHAAAEKQARDIHARGQALLKEAFTGKGSHAADQFARYLIAASELIEQDAKLPQKAASVAVAFADFENGYGAWKVEGDAFGQRPASGTFPGQQQVSGFIGKGLVNTWNGSDEKRGRALSPEFTLERPYLHFLIGGGGHAGQTCVNLLIDGKTVLSATGKNNEKLDPHTWDLAAYHGKKARIEIVDDARGGWGHVNVDQFVFSEAKTLDPAAAERPFDPALAKRIAMQQGMIDEATLLHWARLLRGPAANDARHPLHAWKTGKPAPQRPAGVGSTKLLADFENGDADGWTVTGFSFDAKPTVAPTWSPGMEGSLVVPAGVMSSASVPAKFHGVLRSPTFELTHSRIHLKMNVKAATVRLVIDGHHMNLVHQLLLRGTILKENDTNTNGEFRWLTMQGNLDKYIGHRVYLEISDHGGGYAAIDEVVLSEGDPPAEPALTVTGENREALAQAYGRAFAAGDPTLTNLVWRENLWPKHADFAALTEEMAKVNPPQPQFAIAMLDGTPEEERIHIRGSHLKLGETVPRRNLAALGGQEAPVTASGRLELARELTTGENPLVRRVAVNRVWHHLFGRGLVATVDDFGAMGEAPSHPELLDWLATEFSSELGWSQKKLLRAIVLSRAYRMSSAPHPALDRAKLATIDPGNILLHRAPVRRLQGEAIRDAILAVSGRLDAKVGGPSVPVHLTAFMDGRGRPGGGPLDGAGRRSLYTEIRRNFLPPFLLTFDMPIPFNAMGRRSVSNVPAQALSLMNDPFVTEQAKLWAEKISADAAKSDAAKLDEVFRAAFGRAPSTVEQGQITGYLAAEPDKKQAWTDLCHALFNKKEFIYLN